MGNEREPQGDPGAIRRAVDIIARVPMPRPTVQFRRRAWHAFQRAIDPLAPPRPMPKRRQ